MILGDLEELKSKNYDVCIIGTGPAGITTAIGLNRAIKVLLVEAGGMSYSGKSQEFYDGTVIGDKYFDLKICRLRQFGGTSNHWGGKCRTLGEFDFSYKDYAPEASWPIDKQALDPYLSIASSILKIGSDFKRSPYTWDTSVEEIPFKYSPPVRFNQQYFDLISKSENIDLITDTVLSGVRLARSSIDGLILTGKSGAKIHVKAKNYVFAMGGIENGRILKFIAVDNPSSSLGKNLNVGAYWMEHPHFTVGDIFYNGPVYDRWAVAISDQPKRQFKPVNQGFNHYWTVGLSDQQKRKLKVLNCGLGLRINITHPDDSKTKSLIRDLMCANKEIGTQVSLGLGKNYCGGLIEAAWEQTPSFDNRIDLASDVDSFGIPKVVLKWKKSDMDLRTVRLTAEHVAESMVKNKLAKIRLNEWLWNGQYPEGGSLGGCHHMGGTRMSKSRSGGVVDPNLRSWDLSNLFIAGSSVFPSGGHANPTLTIVQLASRLATYLNTQS